jgi:hypothetical protein
LLITFGISIKARKKNMANRIVQRVKNAFGTGVARNNVIGSDKGVSSSARKAIVLTAEGNVYLSKGAVVTKSEIASMRKKVVGYAF